MACATGPLIVDHGSRNNIRYNAAAADWTARRDSLTGEGIAFMHAAHWLNAEWRSAHEAQPARGRCHNHIRTFGIPVLLEGLRAA